MQLPSTLAFLELGVWSRIVERWNPRRDQILLVVLHGESGPLVTDKKRRPREAFVHLEQDIIRTMESDTIQLTGGATD